MHTIAPSTAGGTVHTSAISECIYDPPIPAPLDKSRPTTSAQVSPDTQASQDSQPSQPEDARNAMSAPQNHTSRARPPSGVPSDAPPPFPSSLEPDNISAPLILPTEIGRALSYAPPDVQSSAISLFRSFFLRSRPGGADSQTHIDVLTREVDSGLRMPVYDDAGYVPPPEYTTQ